MKPVGRKCWTECYRLRPAEGAEKRVSGTTSTSSPDQGRAGRTDIVRTVESRPRQTDYLGRAVEIAERVAHGLKLPQPKTTRKIGLTMPLGELPRLRARLFPHALNRSNGLFRQGVGERQHSARDLRF